jgi:hypothetical protein
MSSGAWNCGGMGDPAIISVKPQDSGLHVAGADGRIYAISPVPYPFDVAFIAFVFVTTLIVFTAAVPYLSSIDPPRDSMLASENPSFGIALVLILAVVGGCMGIGIWVRKIMWQALVLAMFEVWDAPGYESGSPITRHDQRIRAQWQYRIALRVARTHQRGVLADIRENIRSAAQQTAEKQIVARR